MKTVSTFGPHGRRPPPARRCPAPGSAATRGARHRGRPAARARRAGAHRDRAAAARVVALRARTRRRARRCLSRWSASTCASSSPRAWSPASARAARCATAWSITTSADIVVAAVTHAGEYTSEHAQRGARMTGAAVRATRQRAAISALLENARRVPLRPGTARRTAPPRRGHRPDHRLPHPAVDGRRRLGRHVAHRHRRIGVPALLRPPPPPPGVPGVRLARSRCRAAQVETWAAEVAREHGFSDVSHTIEIFGVCGGCAPD